MKQSFFLSRDYPIVFAHRGGNLEAIGNSPAAFERAVKLGYQYAEVDAYGTKDGQLVVYHDKKAEGLLGVLASFARNNPAFLRRRLPRKGFDQDKMRRRNYHSGSGDDSSHHFLSIADLLAAFPQLKFCLDIKNWAAVRPLAELLIETGTADRVVLGSFSKVQCQEVAELVKKAGGPDMPMMMGFWEIIRLCLHAYHLPTLGWRPDPMHIAALPKEFATSRIIKAAHKLDIRVMPWTVNDLDLAEKLLDLGVNGLFTDRPKALRDLLVKRGQWPTKD